MTLLMTNPTEKRRLLTPTIEILKSGLFGGGYQEWKQEGDAYVLVNGINVDFTNKYLSTAFDQFMEELGIKGAALQDVAEIRIGNLKNGRTNLIVTIPKTAFESKIKPHLHATCAIEDGVLYTTIRDIGGRAC